MQACERARSLVARTSQAQQLPVLIISLVMPLISLHAACLQLVEDGVRRVRVARVAGGQQLRGQRVRGLLQLFILFHMCVWWQGQWQSKASRFGVPRGSLSRSRRRHGHKPMPLAFSKPRARGERTNALIVSVPVQHVDHELGAEALQQQLLQRLPPGLPPPQLVLPEQRPGSNRCLCCFLVFPDAGHAQQAQHALAGVEWAGSGGRTLSAKFTVAKLVPEQVCGALLPACAQARSKQERD